MQAEAAGLRPYPAWVCRGCAEAALATAGSPPRRPGPHTRLMGSCRVCQQVTSVCCPRNYGWPRFEGHAAP